MDELLIRTERMVAALGAFSASEALDAEACDAIAATLNDLMAEVSRLRDALRDQGVTTEAAITAAAARGARALECARGNDPARPLVGFRVLVVDDEPDTLEALTLVLHRAGATVRAYPDALSALAGTRTSCPHVLVSDLAMPGYDGLWLVRQIRASDRLLHLPVLALSAHALPSDVQDARDAGFDAHLAKPTLPERLIAEVARLAATAVTHGRD